MADTQRFLNTYNIVIDENGNLRTCGREACMNLISVTNEIEPEIRLLLMYSLEYNT